jgi:hypothetical protein
MVLAAAAGDALLLLYGNRGWNQMCYPQGEVISVPAELERLLSVRYTEGLLSLLLLFIIIMLLLL